MQLLKYLCVEEALEQRSGVTTQPLQPRPCHAERKRSIS